MKVQYQKLKKKKWFSSIFFVDIDKILSANI